MANPLPPPKAIIFDLMGTCLDWHSSIVPSLIGMLPQECLVSYSPKASELALQWRQGFFDEIHDRFERGEAQEDIDVTHRRVLLELLKKPEWKVFIDAPEMGIDACVAAWHKQTGMLRSVALSTPYLICAA